MDKIQDFICATKLNKNKSNKINLFFYLIYYVYQMSL